MSIVDKLLEAEGAIQSEVRVPDLGRLLHEAASEIETLAAVNAELLEALDTLVRYCSHNAMDELLPEGWQKTCHFREMLAAARAAIAKARGIDDA